MTNKFRPYLTSPELESIIHALKAENKPANSGLIRYLETFAIKIERGVIAPSHILAPTLTLDQKLGFAEPPAPPAEKSKLALYNQWLSNPSSLSPTELELVNLYRYENDMMDPQEEAQFELLQSRAYQKG